ncbi:SDR family oxidoreductase [Chthonobacter rhizosphaerae]|uniref:SDR family oxidoreductase n=1 Tax=Chthonobacter rhizosphaerae TaxID=2735553 RepID=UPI0015EF230B|nr:SDR family oxidoreductase [Chthonobacter rhizosphaerae]
MRLFVFGLGYSALAFVRRNRARFSWIGGTTRSAEKAEALAADGIEPFLFDGTAPGAGVSAALREAHFVLQSIAPAEGAAGTNDPALRWHGADLQVGRKPMAVVYLSTVGVYGDHGGAWVDERTRVKPKSARSVARVAAEEAWTRYGAESGVPTAILRLSGIYGPGRNAFVNLTEGTAKRLVKPGQVFNRIHVDDIAGAIGCALFGRTGGVFNITDDEPAPPQDVVAYAAALMGVEPPPEQDFATATLSPMARSFYGENKRVSNGRSKRDLGLTYAYPTYRAALDRMWREDTWR